MRLSRPMRVCADKLQLLDVVIMPSFFYGKLNVGTVQSIRIDGDDVTFHALDGEREEFEYTTSQGNLVDIVRMVEVGV